MSSPSLTITAEPSQGGAIHYLPLSPSTAGGTASVQINLYLKIKNTGASAVHVTQILLSLPGAATLPKAFATDITIAAGGTGTWTQPDDYVAVLGRSPSMTLQFSADGFSSPATISMPMFPHANPTPDGCYRFWATVDDLRADEYWRVHGTDHGQSNPAQLFAHDVVVAAYDANAPDKYTTLLPGTDGSQNSHHRIWGKPIRAIASGVVVDFRNDFPTNQIPGQVDPGAQAYWGTKPIRDGNGNFFTISGGGETVLYAHMQPGSLNPKLLVAGAAVQAGDFLGLAGNAGAAGGPHLHIHANQTGSGGESWTGNPRPLLFKDVWEVVFTAHGGHPETAPWVKVDRRGFAPAYCAVWPASAKPGAHYSIALQHFALSSDGQLWTSDVMGHVRTTSAKMPSRGVYLDVGPGGSAFRLAVYGSKPYLIGADHRIWEGKPDGWFQVAGSPLCTRLAIDPANGTLWVVRDDRHILHFDPRGRTWIEHPGGGLAKDLCVASAKPYVIGMDDRIWKSAGSAGWSPLPSTQTAVRIASDATTGTLWLLDSAGAVYWGSGDGSWNGYPGVPGTHDMVVSTEIVALDSFPYVIGPDKGLWVGEAKWGWWRIGLVTPST